MAAATTSSPASVASSVAAVAPSAPASLNTQGKKKELRTPLEILMYSRDQAFRGGIAGASAQVVNVLAFMWLRTTMNYQYRYGGTTLGSIKKLYGEGGVVRFYRGLLPALMQSPLSRFGDTAANVGVLAALDASPRTQDLPIGIKTALASCGAAGWRFFLMPLDAWKTTKQVEGGNGLQVLVAKVRTYGVPKLYHGAVAAMGATWVGHYPWFFTHNYLSETLPKFEFTYGKHMRYALIGFASSVVSDTCSNSIRVLKTTKQTSVVPLTYMQTLREVLSKDGFTGLFFRGLGTRILTNGLQGMVFSVGWKAIQDHLNNRK
ncbi:putative MC family transporter [Besnoitia besnoiti]|uniref:Putative MC family transporter n=1 Tax=Besnoitia besnoiti TaxID=94643 RepID=A0A2A9LZK5_BESBE|nr:putative MC family transporter [Besnoitia besnoiti]PFH31818.1 putative MC family transporter [Besnoitia besnoiti]